MPKYLLTFSKTGRAAFIGHLDLQRVFQRALRRSGLPLVFSAGFNPHPKLSFALPLPLGMEGLSEYADIELSESVPEAEIVPLVNAGLPDGVELGAAAPFEGKGSAARVINADYTIRLPADIYLCGNPPYIYERNGTPADVTRDVAALSQDGRVIRATLSAGGERNLKPDVLMRILINRAGADIDPLSATYTRERLILR